MVGMVAIAVVATLDTEVMADTIEAVEMATIEKEVMAMAETVIRAEELAEEQEAVQVEEPAVRRRVRAKAS